MLLRVCVVASLSKDGAETLSVLGILRGRCICQRESMPCLDNPPGCHTIHLSAVILFPAPLAFPLTAAAANNRGNLS